VAAPNPWDLRKKQAEYDAARGANAAAGSQATSSYLSNMQSFNPEDAYKTYTAGAHASSMVDLNNRLRKLRGSAVGAGRLDTGFLDEDTGQTIRDVEGDFNNTISQAALTTAGMRQNQINSMGAYGAERTDAANEMLGSEVDVAQAEANNEADRRRRKRAGIGSAIGGVLGAGAGALFGNPYLGASLGSAVGGSF
jgi:hypothetical protein